MTDTTSYCSNCGQQLASNAKFCSNCGAPVQSGAPSAGASGSSRDEDRDWGGYGSVDTTASQEPRTYPPSPHVSDEPYTGGGFADRKPSWEVERDRLRDGATDEWSMSDLGPARPRRRRVWLWVLLGMIAFAVIACCVFFFWILGTESGTQWFEGIATQAAEEIVRATEQAATPQPE